MNVIDIPIEGISPLLQHNPAAMARPSGTATHPTIPTPEVEAEAGAYRLDSGGLYHPTAGFRAALASAAKGRKIGKYFVTAIVKGSVFPATIVTPLTDPATGTAILDYEIDTRRAVIGKSGVLRSRPRIDKWAATVSFKFDEPMTETLLAELLDIAGRTIGVGDFRPEKAGPFGRFRIA